MGATTNMHQIYHSHIHEKGGAPVESILSLKKNAPDPNRLVRHRRPKRNAQPCAQMVTPAMAFEPNKGSREVVDCGL